MKSKRWRRIDLGVITGLLLVFAEARAGDIELFWDPVTESESGEFLYPDNLVYRIYVKASGWADFVLWFETQDTEYTYQTNDSGCFEIYGTAVRRDSNTESAPSNIVEACIEQGQDGIVDRDPAPAEDPAPVDPMAAPKSPQSVTIDYRD